MSKKINQIAKKDAHDWARAEMFFGEGAGVRRRHLQAQIQKKRDDIPGYAERFDKAYEIQDMASHAISAAKERQRIDRRITMEKNVRAIRSGRTQNLSAGLLAAVVGYRIMKATGYDKVIEEKSKEYYHKLKAEVKRRKDKANSENNVTHLFTTDKKID